MAASRTYVATYISALQKSSAICPKEKRYQWQEGQKKIDTNGYLVARAIH
jgi:hypothetical protein